MISPDHVAMMARYNAWQNGTLMAEAEALGEAGRRLDRGAWFGSIHATFSHLLWADTMWMSRLSDWARPGVTMGESGEMVHDWQTLVAERQAADARLIRWADALDADEIARPLVWFSGISNSQQTRPRWVLLTHLFNHQTHHRGQIHTMLTQAGRRPGVTDLFMMEALV